MELDGFSGLVGDDASLDSLPLSAFIPPHSGHRDGSSIRFLPLVDRHLLQTEAALVGDLQFEFFGELVFEDVRAEDEFVAILSEIELHRSADSAVLVHGDHMCVLFGLERIAICLKNLLYRFRWLDDVESRIVGGHLHHEVSDGFVFDAGVDEDSWDGVSGKSHVDESTQQCRVLASAE